MKRVLLLALMSVSTAFALDYRYDAIYTGEYYPVAYQHTVGPDREYKPLEEFKPNLKPRIKVSLSIPYFKKKANIKRPLITKVFFDFDSYKLKETELNKLKDIKGNVILKGYASPEGTKEYNLKLSKKRIKSVEKNLKNVKVLRKEALGEDGCKEPKERWQYCRKVEIIKR